MNPAIDTAFIDLLKSEQTIPQPGQAEWVPLFDIRETHGLLEVFVDLPGVDEDEIQIESENGMLIIRGARDFDHDNFDAEEFTEIGRPYGGYELGIPLPSGSDANQARAKYKRGVLRVQIPRHV